MPIRRRPLDGARLQRLLPRLRRPAEDGPDPSAHAHRVYLKLVAELRELAALPLPERDEPEPADELGA